MNVRNLGTPLSTTEGWSVVVAGALAAAKQNGWLPSELDPTLTASMFVSGTVAVLFFLRKLFRPGSVPFVQDGHTVAVTKTTEGAK